MVRIKLYYSPHTVENWFPELTEFCKGWDSVNVQEYKRNDSIIIQRLLEEQDLSPRDIQRLVWLINAQIPNLRHKPIVHYPQTKILLYKLSKLTRKRKSKSVFLGLIYSYFQIRKEQVKDPVVFENLEEIKELVIDIWNERNATHTNSSEEGYFKIIFDENSAEIFANKILHGDLEIVRWATSKFKIPTQSWFWEKVFECLCKMISKLEEEEFCSNIDKYLDMLVHAEENVSSPAYPVIVLNVNKIWVALVNRFANSSLRRGTPNQTIKAYCLETWNNPQNPNNLQKWKSAGFTALAIQMICSWCAYSDLVFFFDTLQIGADPQRAEFWRKHISKMSFTCVSLSSSHAYYSYDSEINVFKENNKGRYSVSYNAPSDSDAFIMVIGGFVFVEFSRTSNACFYYRRNNNRKYRADDNRYFIPLVPFNIYSEHFDFIQELKGRNIGLDQYSSNRIIHSIGWQDVAEHLIDLAMRDE